MMVKMKKIFGVVKGIVFLAVAIIFCFIRLYALSTTETPDYGSMRTAMTMENGRVIFLVFSPQALNWVLFALFFILGTMELIDALKKEKKILPNGMKGR